MGLSAELVEQIAGDIATARREGRRIPVPNVALATTGDVYRIQDAVAARLGPVGAWKVGAKAPDAPCNCAPIPRSVMHEGGGPHVIPAPHALGLEVEIAYRLGRSVAPASAPPSREAILDAVASAHVSMEVCDFRWVGGPDVDPLWKLADAQVNGALIVGPAISGWRDLDHPHLPATLDVNGRRVADTVGGLPTVDPRNMLVWLVQHAVTQRGGIEAGVVITTGSWIGLPWFEAPAEVIGGFKGLGEVRLRLDATGRA